MGIELSGLVAYPSALPEIGAAIRSCLEKIHKDRNYQELRGWEESNIAGHFISTEVINLIENGTIFIADITRLNFNVVFEVGYAIGCKKRVFLLRNEAITPDSDLIRRVGIFDTLGYVKYRNSDDLLTNILEISDSSPIRFDEYSASSSTPVYILLPSIKGETETYLIAKIKKARLFYRSFDPEEHGRLSALEAIEYVAKSHGIVIPLLQPTFDESEVHNYRAAFVAGLAQGMKKQLLLLQSGAYPIPLDYRDLVRSFKFKGQIAEYISEFAVAVTESLQSQQSIVLPDTSTFLTQLNLGASSAENEFQELGNYYIETDEFKRALKGEVQIVIGRKGSGKTALFFQLRDRVRSNRNNVVLDLKPEGFQLIKFKEQVLDFLEEGTREHTITAFWEYLLLLEICHKLLQNDKRFHLRDHNLYEPYRKLASLYESDKYIAEGDFSERMLQLIQRISEDFSATKESSNGGRLSREKITEYIYKHDIISLNKNIANYLRNKESLWILFDNLDKGWPPQGVKPEDALNLRCLLDAMGKLTRHFNREGIPTRGLIFIRNDVYENLVATTPDRGKISHAMVDWTDPELLLELLRRRFLASDVPGDPSFENIWPQVCVSHLPNGEETAHYMIERCLMRPRFLIDMLRFCRSHAVNLGHKRIEVQDIEKGEEQYSTQLINDISFELQDVFPLAKDVLYEFIECPSEINSEKLHTILAKLSTDNAIEEKIRDLLLWYGFLGFRRILSESTYIYTVSYDMKRLKALLKKHEESGILYVINPAFWKGLEIRAV